MLHFGVASPNDNFSTSNLPTYFGKPGSSFNFFSNKFERTFLKSIERTKSKKMREEMIFTVCPHRLSSKMCSKNASCFFCALAFSSFFSCCCCCCCCCSLLLLLLLLIFFSNRAFSSKYCAILDFASSGNFCLLFVFVAVVDVKPLLIESISNALHSA